MCVYQYLMETGCLSQMCDVSVKKPNLLVGSLIHAMVNVCLLFTHLFVVCLCTGVALKAITCAWPMGG